MPYAPHVRWYVWTIGFLALAVFWVFDSSYKLHNAELKEAENSKLALSDRSPKMFLQYSDVDPAFVLERSGLFIHNGGETDGFKVRLTCDLETNAEVRLRFTGMPIQRVGPGKSEAVQVSTDYRDDDRWCPIEGAPSVQIQDFFETLNRENGESTVPVTISYSDYEGREYTAKWAIRSEGIFLVTKRIWCEPL